MFEVPQLSYLELQDQLKSAVSAFAKRFGVSRQKAWELLSQQDTPNSSLEEMLDGMGDSKVNHQINQWWKANKSNLSALGLEGLQRASKLSASKLPESTRRQIVCLIWLEGALQAEQRVRERKQRIKVVEPQLVIWQRCANWLKRLFSR